MCIRDRLIAALSTLAKASHLYAVPKVPSEQFVGVGIALIALGFMTNAMRGDTRVRLPLLIVTTGTAVLAGATWVAIGEFTDGPASSYYTAFALIETAIVFLLVRWGLTIPHDASALGRRPETAVD